MKVCGALATSPRANQGFLMLLLGSLLDRHKVAGVCITAFGKSLMALLLLVCKQHHYEITDLDTEACG